MRSRRFLVLHLPRLATDRIRQKEPELADLPVAAWSTLGNRRLLTGVDAPGTTLRVGQALADAQAMHPELVLRPADPEADVAFLERLALWATRFTPLAANRSAGWPGAGRHRLRRPLRGEVSLLAYVSSRLQRGGVAAVAVLAGVAECRSDTGACRTSHQDCQAWRGRRRDCPLPLGTLRLSHGCLAGLNRLGLHCVNDVLRQPRAPLSRRFGRPLMDLLDALTGERPA